jgi:hypothetical protein
MNNILKRITTLALVAGLPVVATAGSARAEEKSAWKLSVEPFLMMTSISGDASVGRVTGAPVDVAFEDILENLQFAAMLHAEAFHQSGWGVLFDNGYMDLGADISGPLGGVTDVGVKQGVLELLAAKKFPLEKGSFDLIGGLRWWDNSVDITVNPAILPGSANLSIDESWIDPVIGVRLTFPLTKPLKLVLRGDIGGFGVGSDFSALAMAGVHYRFNDMLSLDLQYKALWVDYADGTQGTPGYFAYDTVTHGPLVGFIFEF